MNELKCTTTMSRKDTQVKYLKTVSAALGFSYIPSMPVADASDSINLLPEESLI